MARGFWATSIGTLASRGLGVARDVVTAALLGLGQGGVMDALVVAFRLPNLSRRIFGEGALAASFLPVFAAERSRDPQAGWRLLSTLLATLAVGLTGLLLAGEAVCFLAWWLWGDTSYANLIGLSAVLLPYMLLVCLAAQVSAALQGMMRFRAAALAPLALNLCWLAAAWLVAPRLSDDPAVRAYVIAVAIVVAGALQLAVQVPALLRAGFRWQLDWRAASPAVRQVGRAMLPIALGLAVTQLNTLLDSVIAIVLAAPPGGERSIGWLGGAVRYPLETGAAAAIYYGERFYQVPVGVLGIALATVIYPLLARHAAHGNRKQLTADLALGLRLVWFTALPAGVGIVLLAEPLVRVLFQHGAFTADDTRRAAAMIACYASAAWAYCALPLLVRGFYAIGERGTPARIGVVAVGINLAATAALLWPLGERALAISTAVAASLQVALLGAAFSRVAGPLPWRTLARTAGQGVVATAAMAAIVLLIERLIPEAAASLAEQVFALILAIGGGLVAYLTAARLLRMRELELLFGAWPARRQNISAASGTEAAR